MAGLLQASDRITDRQYAAIGRVAAVWAEVEWAMERILGRLALVPSLLGYVLTDKLGPDNRIGAINSLINVHRVKYHAQLVDNALLTEIEEYMPSIGQMKGDRNYIVHSVWAKATDNFLSHFNITGTARSGFDTSAGPAQPVKAIEDFADEVQKAATLLWEFGARIPTIQPASLGKLLELEESNRRRPGGAAMRQLQPKSFARLQRKVPPQPKQPKSKRAKA